MNFCQFIYYTPQKNILKNYPSLYNNFRRHKPQNDNYRVVTNVVTFTRVYFSKSHKILTIKDRDPKFEIPIICVMENTLPK